MIVSCELDAIPPQGDDFSLAEILTEHLMIEAQEDYVALADGISRWLLFQMEHAGASRLVLGLSGGIDSAVACALCTMAAGPSRVIAAIMPIQSRAEDRRDAESVARTFDVSTRVIELSAAFDAMVAALPGEGVTGLEDADVAPGVQEVRHQLALANIKPRLRMTALYALANQYGGLVVGTGNKTELSIGYFTKYGDGGVDVLPLGDLDKTAVRGLARVLGVPEAVIAKAPSAGLWEGQTDEEEIGLSYAELDAALSLWQAGRQSEVNPLVASRVAELASASEHKRQPVPVYRRDEIAAALRP